MNSVYTLAADILELLALLMHYYIYVLIISAILSWLVAFDIVNPYNRVVKTIGDFCYRVTEPPLRPIRKVLPTINGIDLSPLALMALVWLTERMFIFWSIELNGMVHV